MLQKLADKPSGWGRLGDPRKRHDPDCGLAQGSRGDAYKQRGLGLNMANTPKKFKDPTEDALSAIQEALNISDTAADTSRNASARTETGSSMAPPVPPVFDE